MLKCRLNCIIIHINCFSIICIIMHPRPPRRHIGIDSFPLILSFQLKFLCADMFPYEDFKTVSVHLSVPREKNHPGFVNIIPTLVIDTSLERSSRVLHHGSPKIRFFFPKSSKFDFFFQKSSKFEFWLVTKSWNHLSFVKISPTLEIDTSMERSSRVLQHRNPKIRFKKKSSKLNFDLYFDLCWKAEITLASLI